MIQLVWLTLLAVHTGAAAVWWWLMPGGFPGSSTEYWVNEVAPFFCVALLATALFARGRFNHVILPPVLAAIPAFWMAFGISSRLTFDESFRSLWNLPFIGGVIVGGLWIPQFRLRLVAKWLVPLIVLPAAIAGWSFPGTQRSPEPSTTPAGAAFDKPPAGAAMDRKVIRLSKDAQVRPDDGRVVVRRDALILNVQPMLSFANRSIDRCWTALAPEGTSTATSRIYSAKVHDGAHWNLWYRDESESLLDVSSARDGAVELDARSRLGKAVFAHVDSYAELTVSGHKKLTVAFSPAPQQRIEVAPATGAMRFAYLDANDTFHVVQAKERQRGPFTELAAGRLKRGDPLVLTIYDGDKAAFTVTFADWAAQASTALSPTAGWGVPVNAIEMQRGGEPETSPVLITLTLADTSIGRGTSSVGHAPGVYRDRITIRLP